MPSAPAGVMGYNAHYVLSLGLAAAIIAFAVGPTEKLFDAYRSSTCRVLIESRVLIIRALCRARCSLYRLLRIIVIRGAIALVGRWRRRVSLLPKGVLLTLTSSGRSCRDPSHAFPKWDLIVVGGVCKRRSMPICSGNPFLNCRRPVIVSRDYNKAITAPTVISEARLFQYLVARSLYSSVLADLYARQFQCCFASTFFGWIVC